MHSEWLARFQGFDAVDQSEQAAAAIVAVDRFFDVETARHGGADAVVAFELEGIGLAEDAYIKATTATDLLGHAWLPRRPPLLAEEPYPDYRNEQQRKLIASRRDLLSHRPEMRILAGREAARRALSLNFWQIASNFIEQASAEAEHDLDVTSPAFAAAAEHYLKRLIKHPIAGLNTLENSLPLPQQICPKSIVYQSNPRLLLDDAPAIVRDSTEGVSSPSTRLRLFPVADTSVTITGVFDAWAAAQPAHAAKLCDEWRVAVRRFVSLFGNVEVANIDSDMIADFRDGILQMPSRPARAIAALPVMDQIKRAKDDGLNCLSSASVAKLTSGLRVALDFACDPLRIIRSNPAATIKVRKSDPGDNVRLPFDEADMRLIFDMLGRENTDLTMSDAEFWLEVLAPLTGMRIEEMGVDRRAKGTPLAG